MKTVILVKNNTVLVNSQPVSLPFINPDIYIRKATEFYTSFEGKFFLLEI